MKQNSSMIFVERAGVPSSRLKQMLCVRELKQFELPIPKDKRQCFMTQCLYGLADFLPWLIDSHQLQLDRDEARVLNALSKKQIGKVMWLAHLILNRGRKTPRVLKDDLKFYEQEAQLSEALLKVIERVCDSTNLFTEWKPDELNDDDLPAWVWLSCEISFICLAIEESRVGQSLGIPELSNPHQIVGKDRAAREGRQFVKFLEGMESSKPVIKHSPDPSFLFPYFAVLEAAKRISRIDDDFESKVWTPYLKLMRRNINRFRKTKNIQAMLLKAYETPKKGKPAVL